MQNQERFHENVLTQDFDERQQYCYEKNFTIILLLKKQAIDYSRNLYKGIPYMQVIQDTLSLSLTEENTVINRTVKLNATIVALVLDTTEEALRSEIKITVNKLVDSSKLDVEWNFSNTTRSIDDSGYERVQLTATIRIPETENYNLDKRAIDASRSGLKITSVTVDSSIPQSMLDEAESDLRLKLAAKAKAECEKLSTIMGHAYRINAISFGSVQNFSPSNLRSLGAANATKHVYGSGFTEDDDTLGNASKLTMGANIILARIHAYAINNENETNLRVVAGTEI